jgi:hypothetical protein
MRDYSTKIPEKCTEAQTKTIKEFLEKGWKVDSTINADGSILIEKGFCHYWIYKNGGRCSA